jgi:O-antigen/teichoic acid export membrane protein
MSNTKIYFINVFAQTTGRIYASVVGLIVFVLIARLWGTEALGQYSYILTFLGLFMIVADFGTQAVFSKDVAQQKESAGLYWGNFIIVRLGLNLVTIALAIVLAYFLRRDLFAYLALASLAMPFLSSRFFEPLYQVYHRPWFSTYTTLIFGTCYLVFSIIAGISSSSLWPIVIAYLAANVIYTVMAFIFSARLLKPVFQVNRKMVIHILKLATPMGVSSLFTIINSKAAVFMLAAMKTDHEVGLFNAAYRFLDIVAILASTCVIPIMPIFAHMALHNRSALKQNYVKIIELLGVALIPVAIFVPHCSVGLMSFLFGKEFGTAAEVLNILSWVGVMVFFSLVCSAVNLAVGDVAHGYWNAALAASVNIALNYFWIPHYSYIGCSWTTLISEIILLGISLCFVIKNLGPVLDVHKWIRIVLANVILYILLEVSGNTHILIKASLSVVVYGTLVYTTKLISLKDIHAFLLQRRKVQEEKMSYE